MVASVTVIGPDAQAVSGGIPIAHPDVAVAIDGVLSGEVDSHGDVEGERIVVHRGSHRAVAGPSFGSDRVNPVNHGAGVRGVFEACRVAAELQDELVVTKNVVTLRRSTSRSVPGELTDRHKIRSADRKDLHLGEAQGCCASRDAQELALDRAGIKRQVWRAGGADVARREGH